MFVRKDENKNKKEAGDGPFKKITFILFFARQSILHNLSYRAN